MEWKIGLLRIVTPENIKFGIHLLNRVFSKGHLPGPDAHAIADPLHRDEIRTSESSLKSLGHLHHLKVFNSDGTAEDAQYLRSKFFLQTLQLIGNFCQGIVPGDSLPFAIDFLQRIFETVGMIDQFDGSLSFRAESPLVQRMVFKSPPLL